MSNLYNVTKEAFLTTGALVGSGTIRAMLTSNAYTFSASETVMTTPASARLGTDQTLASKTTTGGVFDAADITFPAVASGATANAVIIYRYNTNDADSVPIAYITIASASTNGGDITVQWDNGASKIFAIGG